VSLINCPECNKEISDKAVACPSCGFPISQTDDQDETKLECPTFPSDLSIGSSPGLLGWFVKGKFISENSLPNLTEVHVRTHDRGIKISTGTFLMKQLHSIHTSQLINISENSEVELVQQDKSVVGRAAVGALLFGPFGAIVGGLSGLNAAKSSNKNMLVISFWDTETREPNSIVIRSGQPLAEFVKNTKIKLKLYY
jgi:hypothetical protein